MKLPLLPTRIYFLACAIACSGCACEIFGGGLEEENLPPDVRTTLKEVRKDRVDAEALVTRVEAAGRRIDEASLAEVKKAYSDVVSAENAWIDALHDGIKDGGIEDATTREQIVQRYAQVKPKFSDFMTRANTALTGSALMTGEEKAAEVAAEVLKALYEFIKRECKEKARDALAAKLRDELYWRAWSDVIATPAGSEQSGSGVQAP